MCEIAFDCMVGGKVVRVRRRGEEGRRGGGRGEGWGGGGETGVRWAVLLVDRQACRIMRGL